MYLADGPTIEPTDLEPRTVTMGSTVAAGPRLEDSSTSEDFDAFFRRLYPRVAGFFHRKHVRPQDVDDLTQSTLMGMLMLWNETEPDDRERRLFLIARNKFIDHLRVKTRRQEVSVPAAELSERPCPLTDPASVVVSRDEARLVRVAVEREAPKSQVLLHGRYVQRREYGDLACDLGTTEGALRALMGRTLGRLRSTLVELDVRSLVPSIPALPCLGWRWARRSAAPPWMVAAGHGAFVSVVATTMVMAPPAAVPAAATPPRAVAAVSGSGQPAPPPDTTGHAGGQDRSEVGVHPGSRTAPDGTASAAVDYGKPGIKVPVPQVSVQPAPEPPCVGVCEKPAETLTVHLPIENGEVSQEQNVLPVCRHIPAGQPGVTCRENEGTKYAVSPPPRPAEG